MLSISLRLLIALLLGLSLLACNGSDDSGGREITNPPVDNDDDDDDDDDGNTNEGPTVSFSPDGQLGATEVLVVNFSEPMDRDSLALGGTLAEVTQSEWAADDTLELSPPDYWPPGEHELSIDAESVEGVAMRTVESTFTVDNAFGNFQRATAVIGQQDFNSGEPRQGDELSAGPQTLDRPSGNVGYSAENELLFIADTWDSRLLGFDSIANASNPTAELVIGQPDMWTSRGGTSSSTMRTPQHVSADEGRLIATDSESHRVTIYDPLPLESPGEASVVLGQADFDSWDPACGPSSLNHPHGHFVTPAGRFLVADGVNNRVLIWDQIPTESGQAPDLVIGQSRFDTCAANDDNQVGLTSEDTPPSARTLQHPTSIWSDDEKLVVVDNYNNRVLVWHEFPTENFAEADVVLGQASMDAMAANDDNQDGLPDAQPSARVLDYPWSAWVKNGQLFVADENNSRVLAWNALPEESFTPADLVIGQNGFQSGEPNAGAEIPDANTLNLPKGVRVIGNRLYVTDTGNSRVLVFEAR